MTERIVNAVRLTEKMHAAELVHAGIGRVSSLVWCKSEVERMRAKKANVRVRQCGELVWIVRDASEVARAEGWNAT